MYILCSYETYLKLTDQSDVAAPPFLLAYQCSPYCISIISRWQKFDIYGVLTMSLLLSTLPVGNDLMMGPYILTDFLPIISCFTIYPIES